MIETSKYMSLTTKPLNMPKFTQLHLFHIFASLTCIYAALIFYLSSLTDPTTHISDISLIPQIIETIEKHSLTFPIGFLEYLSYNSDKIGHITLYFGFGILLYLTLNNTINPQIKKHAIIIAVILGTIYGLTDEIHQSFVPGRTASITDLLVDSIGVALAQAFMLASPIRNFSKKFKQ